MFAVTPIDDRIHAFLEEPGSDLPVFDRTALLVHQEAIKRDPDTDKIVSYIVQDQVLAAEVLKVANSSFSGASRRSAAFRTPLCGSDFGKSSTV